MLKLSALTLYPVLCVQIHFRAAISAAPFTQWPNVVTFANQLPDLRRHAATSKAPRVSDGASAALISAAPLRPRLQSNCEEFSANFSDRRQAVCQARRAGFVLQHNYCRFYNHFFVLLKAVMQCAALARVQIGSRDLLTCYYY